MPHPVVNISVTDQYLLLLLIGWFEVMRAINFHKFISNGEVRRLFQHLLFTSPAH